MIEENKNGDKVYKTLINAKNLIDLVLEKKKITREEYNELMNRKLTEEMAVNRINPHFLCGICMEIVTDPIKCDGPCESLFCNKCIRKWKLRNDTCPQKCQREKQFRDG